jgi:hypothetical protein
VKVLIPVRVKTGAWLGGANYFLSLARALGTQPRPGGASVVIATNRPDWFESARGDAVEGPGRALARRDRARPTMS